MQWQALFQLLTVDHLLLPWEREVHAIPTPWGPFSLKRALIAGVFNLKTPAQSLWVIQ